MRRSGAARPGLRPHRAHVGRSCWQGALKLRHNSNMRQIALALLLLLVTLRLCSAAERSDCGAAIATAERANDLPAGLLAAIARVESGRADPANGAIRPWPWTIDAGGAAHFFATKAAAIAAAESLEAQGVTAIDVGCLQVDLAFHPTAFASLEAAFEPLVNALYAAHFLRSLFTATGDWAAAAAAYHSQTQAIAAPYRQKVLAVWTAAGSAPSQPPGAHAAGFTPPAWFAAAARDDAGAPMRFAGAPSRPGSAAKGAPAWFARVFSATSDCASATPRPSLAPSGQGPARQPPGNCPPSPFATTAALRRLIARP